MTDASNDPNLKTNPDSGGEPAAGAIIADRYRLTSRLGGMGAVFKGEHLSLKKPVAVKFLHRFASGDSEMVARFEREAQTAALIDHPNVAKANDFGKLPDGTFYLVMEYVEGPTLTAVLRETPRLPPARALKIASEIGSALERAHALGIVHRDIKPDNIVLCSRDGDRDFVKVIDFGIARTSNANTALTQMGTVFGTPGYLSPEQALGQQVDAAADQYALGIVTFQMLTGRMPFAADDAISLLQQHIMAPIPRASDFASELPRAIDDVVARMMAKRAIERFPSMEAAVSALRGAIESAPAPFAGTAATVANRPAPALPPPAASSWAGAPNVGPNTQPHPTAAPMSTIAPAGMVPAKSPSRLIPIIAIAAVLGIGIFAVTRLRGGEQPVAATPAPVANTPVTPTPPEPTRTAANPTNLANVAQPATPLQPQPVANPADAATAAVVPHTVGASSHNCRDGHCICRNALPCSYTCGDEPCDALCERMRDCRGTCGDHCQQTCRDGQQCDLRCGDDCHVTSRNVHDTRVSCGENCAVDCSMMMVCSVRMQSGDVTCGERTGRCDVQCHMPDGAWAMATRCARGRYHCPPGPCP